MDIHRQRAIRRDIIFGDDLIMKYIFDTSDEIKKVISARVYVHNIDEFRRLQTIVDALGGTMSLSTVINTALQDAIREATTFLKTKDV